MRVIRASFGHPVQAFGVVYNHCSHDRDKIDMSLATLGSQNLPVIVLSRKDREGVVYVPVINVAYLEVDVAGAG